MEIYGSTNVITARIMRHLTTLFLKQWALDTDTPTSYIKLFDSEKVVRRHYFFVYWSGRFILMSVSWKTFFVYEPRINDSLKQCSKHSIQQKEAELFFLLDCIENPSQILIASLKNLGKWFKK